MEEDRLTSILSVLETAMDLLFLNVLWLVCCFPVITIGISTTAMHYVAQKMVANEDYHIWSDFFHSFKQNWKQGIAVELILAVMAFIAIADFWTGTNLPGTIGMACQIIGVITALVWIAILGMIFPLIARYRNSLIHLLKNALILEFTNPHIFLINIVLIAAWPVIIWLYQDAFLVALPILLLIYEAFSAYMIQMLLRPVYRKVDSSQGV